MHSHARSLINMIPGTLILLSVMLSQALGESKPPIADGKTLFEQKCLKCHKPSKFTSQHNNRQSWEGILSRMQRNGCSISEEEISVMAEYLAKEHGEE